LKDYSFEVPAVQTHRCGKLPHQASVKKDFLHRDRQEHARFVRCGKTNALFAHGKYH